MHANSAGELVGTDHLLLEKPTLCRRSAPDIGRKPAVYFAARSAAFAPLVLPYQNRSSWYADVLPKQSGKNSSRAVVAPFAVSACFSKYRTFAWWPAVSCADTGGEPQPLSGQIETRPAGKPRTPRKWRHEENGNRVRDNANVARERELRVHGMQ